MVIGHRARVFKITSVLHLTADPNVLSTPIAHQIRLVLMRSVKILAMEHVELEHNVRSQITFQSVVAKLVTLEIHSLNVFKLFKHQSFMMILAILHLVVPMRDATMECAHVFRNSGVTHTQVVDQSVFLVLNVHQTKHV